ncbi:MAG: SurA N-terminal domain-containing protein, partial [Alphaproteobacteria bacterium]
MLSSLKQFASSWVSQLLLVLLVLSFAVWGIADIFTGFGASAVATVGKSEVTLLDYQRRYGESVQILQRRLGTALTQQQAAQFGIPGQVLSILVSEATLDNEGQEMGLGLSSETLSRLITSDPQLMGPSGVYSEGYLRQLVGQRGYNLDDFVVSRRQQYVRNQITDAFAGGLAVPETYMRAFTEFRDEQRTIDYALI